MSKWARLTSLWFGLVWFSRARLSLVEKGAEREETNAETSLSQHNITVE